MKISVDEKGGVAVVKLSGSLTGGDEGWHGRVTELVDQPSAKVVLEMAEVDYISSAGLGELVKLTALANTQGSRVVLAAPTPFVAGVLKTTRLDRFFDICPDVDSALTKLK